MLFARIKKTLVTTNGVTSYDVKEPVPARNELDVTCKRVDRAVKHIANHNIFVVSEDPNVHGSPACTIIAYSASTMHRALDQERTAGIKRLVYRGDFAAIPINFVSGGPKVQWAIRLRGLGPNCLSVEGRYDAFGRDVLTIAKPMSLFYSSIYGLPFSELGPVIMNELLDEYGIGGALGFMRVNPYRDGVSRFCAADDPNGFFQLMMNAGNSYTRIKELLKSHLKLKIKLDDSGVLTIVK